MVLVECGFYRASRRGNQAPDLGDSGSPEQVLTGMAVPDKDQGTMGTRKQTNDSSWLRAQKTYGNAFMQTKIRF